VREFFFSAIAGSSNDILRRIRYAFDFGDSKMMSLFALAGQTVTREQVSAWLKKDDDPALQSLSDRELAIFINGLIIDKRGKREGPQAEPELQLNNNVVLRKLKIALNLIDDDVLKLLKLAGMQLSKHELSAFFRKPEHPHYRPCKDQVLRNFLSALARQQRPSISAEPTQKSAPSKPPAKPAFKWQ